MQNFDKIYPTRIDISNIGEKLFPKLKKLFRFGFPYLWKFAVAGLILLMLQALAVGFADRLRISPKISFLLSSFIYSVALSFLAVLGGFKISEQAGAAGKPFLPGTNAEPVCKILIIRKKGEPKI